MRLSVDGTPVFYGPVVEAPHPRDPRRGTVNLVGAAELLDRRVIGNDAYKNVDVGAIARDLVSRFRHPALAFDPAFIPNTGKILSEFTMPWRTLRQALESLGKSIDGDRGVPFGVLPSGVVFFGAQIGAAVPVSYASVKDLQWLRVSGDEVVTQSYMIALTQAAGARASTTAVWPIGYNDGDGGMVFRSGTAPVTLGLPYKPGTYTLLAEDPDWAHVQAEVANLIPDGADVINTPGVNVPAPAVTAGLLNIANALDGDATTAAENDPEGGLYTIQFEQERGVDEDPIIGFRLLYSLDQSGVTSTTGMWNNEVTLYYRYPNAAGPTPDPHDPTQTMLLHHSAQFDFDLEDTKGKFRELIAVRPLPETFLREAMPGPFRLGSLTPVKTYVNVMVDPPADQKLPAGAFKIYAFEPIRLDRQKVDTLARKYLRPPAQQPTEFKLPYLLGITPTVTLTGAPGGDLTGDVAELEFEHSEKGLTTTTVKLEQPGASETARIMRLVARDRARDAQTELRGFLERT
ncbi:hypothetical protein ACFSR9_12065 [Deinococcus taklimakanensis]|uniref:Uncharacterized protein n=1 Tax=Deinococcus taklimakanensis TaxID=536443 RepID=A0ABW5P6V7_9DEIO